MYSNRTRFHEKHHHAQAAGFFCSCLGSNCGQCLAPRPQRDLSPLRPSFQARPSDVSTFFSLSFFAATLHSNRSFPPPILRARLLVRRENDIHKPLISRVCTGLHVNQKFFARAVPNPVIRSSRPYLVTPVLRSIARPVSCKLQHTNLFHLAACKMLDF